MTEHSSRERAPAPIRGQGVFGETWWALVTTAYAVVPVALAWHWWPMAVVTGVTFVALGCVAGWLVIVGRLAMGWNPGADRSAQAMVVGGAILNLVLGVVAWWLVHRPGAIRFGLPSLLLGSAIVLWLSMAGTAAAGAWAGVGRAVRRQRPELP